MTKIEDLTNEQLDVLVATRVMGWAQEDGWWFDPKDPVMVLYTVLPLHEYDANLWSPSTDIAHAFQVDKPEWRWTFQEGWGPDSDLFIEVWEKTGRSTKALVPLDFTDKTAAYCRGRCIAACYACGVTEVE